MYAVMQSGSKQYRVEEGDVVHVELLEERAVGPCIFDEVLFVQEGAESRIGKPFVEGCVVQGEILGEAKGPKVISFKIKRRKNCRKKIGHRQSYARVRITAIGAPDKKPVAQKEPVKKPVEAKVVEKKPEAKVSAPKKDVEKKPVVKKAAPKKEVEKKPTAKKAEPKKPAAKKSPKKKES